MNAAISAGRLLRADHVEVLASSVTGGEPPVALRHCYRCILPKLPSCQWHILSCGIEGKVTWDLPGQVGKQHFRGRSGNVRSSNGAKAIAGHGSVAITSAFHPVPNHGTLGVLLLRPMFSSEADRTSRGGERFSKVLAASIQPTRLAGQRRTDWIKGAKE